MALHPQIQQAIKLMDQLGLKPIEEMDAPAAREQMESMARFRNLNPLPVGRIEDRTMATAAGPVPARFYWPPGVEETALPIVLYFHGGGHVIGSPNTHDAAARAMCVGAAALVISVDYRMGPEHRFPAAVEDSIAALNWAAANARDIGGDADRIAVAGDSAGGNLAAVAAIAARDAGGPALRLQALIYPVADYALVGKSYETYATGFGILTTAGMHWFRAHYLADPSQAADWRASPIRADHLAGVAPALIVAAECDVLFDDGTRYAEALRLAGVPVEYVSFEGMIHGFYGMAPAVDGATAAQARVAEALRQAFA